MKSSRYTRAQLFETMPVGSSVLRQVLPAVASQMVILLYNFADTYFVGMLNDPAQTAAMTVSSSSFIMLTAISNLFGVGGGSALAAALGKDRPEEGRQIAVLSLYGGLVAAILYALIFALASRPILYLCGANGQSYSFAAAYTRWTVIYGGVFTVMNTLLANLVRAEGEAGAASLGVSLGGLLNILLDPFFVLPSYLGLGAEGAGMATAISNLFACGYFAFYMYRKRRSSFLSATPALLAGAKKHLKPVMLTGLPSALQYMLIVVAVSAQSGFISRYSTEAVAALGIAKRLDQLPLNFALGVSSGLLPLLAYNHAAQNHLRRRQAFIFGSALSVGFALVCLVVYELFAPQLAALFIEDELTVDYAAAFLRRMVTAMPLMALCNPLIVQFQAMGRIRESMVCSVLRKGALDIPLLFIMDAIKPLYGCMWVQPIVDSITLIVAYLMTRRPPAKRQKEVKA